jgi:hypothetical protein
MGPHRVLERGGSPFVRGLNIDIGQDEVLHLAQSGVVNGHRSAYHPCDLASGF